LDEPSPTRQFSDRGTSLEMLERMLDEVAQLNPGQLLVAEDGHRRVRGEYLTSWPAAITRAARWTPAPW
jgi:hypothetical protein